MESYGLRTIKGKFRVAESEIVSWSILFRHFDNILANEDEIRMFKFAVEVVFGNAGCEYLNG
jgi:hypothetical protein